MRRARSATSWSASETFVLAPGAVEVYARELGDDVRFLGDHGGLPRSSAPASGGASTPIPPATTTLLEADISGTEVSMRKAGL